MMFYVSDSLPSMTALAAFNQALKTPALGSHRSSSSWRAPPQPDNGPKPYTTVIDSAMGSRTNQLLDLAGKRPVPSTTALLQRVAWLESTQVASAHWLAGSS